jgi:hypothetical protein
MRSNLHSTLLNKLFIYFNTWKIYFICKDFSHSSKRQKQTKQFSKKRDDEKNLNFNELIIKA